VEGRAVDHRVTLQLLEPGVSVLVRRAVDGRAATVPENDDGVIVGCAAGFDS
jgi:hypothetical protein